MTDFARSGAGLFASASLAAHLLRGAAAAALGTFAVSVQLSHPWLSVAAGLIALAALRGCPVCWAIGLVETVARRFAGSGPERL